MPAPSKYMVRGKEAYQFRIKRPDTGKRTKIRLGVVSKNVAQEAGAHIDHMIEAVLYQTDFPPKTAAWLSTLPDELYQRFASAGLVGERFADGVPALGTFLDDYLERKTGGSSRSGGWKSRTVSNRQQSIDDLVRYFGRDTPLDTIDAGSPEEWLAWMTKAKPKGRGLSPATASKKLKDARQFFDFARRKQYVAFNPFEGVRLPPQDNPERLFYVPRKSIEKVLKQVTDPEFRLVIALGRYAGLRIPSEAKQLRWSDLNWAKRTVRITAPKKSGDAAAGQRVCRLFDELVPFLEAIGIPGTESTGHVLSSLQSISRTNLRTQFGRYVDRAKVKRWPRLFQNLRASALTDLAEQYPLPWVCKWLGNSVDVAMRHYVMLKGIDLSEAVFDADNGIAIGGVPETEKRSKKRGAHPGS